MHHGDLVEFRSRWRCEACQRGDRTCIIQRNTGRCLLCNHTGVECMFTRTLSVKGLRDCFQWEWLLNGIPTRSLDEGLSMSRRRSSSGSPQPPRFHRTRKDLRKLWRRAFIVCRVINRLRAVDPYPERVINETSGGFAPTQFSMSKQRPAGISGINEIPDGSKTEEVDHPLDPFVVFDVKSMKELKTDQRRRFPILENEDFVRAVGLRRRARFMSQEGREFMTIAKRQGRACASCRRNKRKVPSSA